MMTDYRDNGGGMEMMTPSATLRWNGDVLEQLFTVQRIGNNGPPGIARQEWIAVPKAPTP